MNNNCLPRPDAAESILLRLDHLTKRFGAVLAVDDLTLSIQPGEIFGFLGPNGAGKTTTLALICGQLRPDAGRILFNGGRRPARIRIGVCPQAVVVWGKLTCLEQLEFYGRMYDIPRGKVRQRGLVLLDAFGLSDQAHRLAVSLSGGMQRRLNLALALVHDPELLILDEPEAGLDPQSRVLVREYIRAWAGAAPGRTVIFTTHNMDEADRLVDRVAIIDNGRLLVLDSPAALKRRVGEGDVLEIHLDLPEETAVGAVLSGLSEMGLAAAIRGETLEVRCPGVIERLPAILAVARQAGFHPGDVRLRQNTLEDVFITLTGRSLRE